MTFDPARVSDRDDDPFRVFGRRGRRRPAVRKDDFWPLFGQQAGTDGLPGTGGLPAPAVGAAVYYPGRERPLFHFDIAPGLEQLTDAELEALAAHGFAFCDEADRAVTVPLGFPPAQAALREHGEHCIKISSEEALRWLLYRRRDLWRKLTAR